MLRLFGEVKPEESATVLLLLANAFVLLVAYYVLKTVREPLILESGAELKSYASAFQAAILVGFVPAYSWLSSRVDRSRLIVAVVLFFVATVEAFYLGSLTRVPHLGFAFFVWVGIFSVATIALFWSYANDLHGHAAGERLFPVIAIGAALGSPVGAGIAERLFASGVPPFGMLHVGAALLLLHLALYLVIERRERGRRAPQARPLASGPGGFGLVLRSPYLRRIAALLVLLNIVNTLGEYVLGRSVVSAAHAAAAADPSLTVSAYIGAFYGRYFFWVNVISVALQAFAVSRIVKLFGIGGALLAYSSSPSARTGSSRRGGPRGHPLGEDGGERGRLLDHETRASRRSGSLRAGRRSTRRSRPSTPSSCARATWSQQASCTRARRGRARA